MTPDSARKSPARSHLADVDEVESEIEISTGRDNPALVPITARQMPPRAASVASSVSSMGGSKRSPSRVKFIADEVVDEEETSLIEDLITKNVVLSLEELDKPTAESPIKYIRERKTSNLSGYVLKFKYM